MNSAIKFPGNIEGAPIHSRVRRRLWLLLASPFLLLATFAIGMILWGYWSTSRVDVRNLKHAKHPLYSGAKRDDGSIDYRSALNEYFGKGVTAENNFAVAVLETVPPFPANRFDSCWLSARDLSALSRKLNFRQPAPYPIERIETAIDNFSGAARVILSFDQQETLKKIREGWWHSRDWQWNQSRIALAQSILEPQTAGLDWIATQVRQRKQYYCPPILAISKAESQNWPDSAPLGGLSDQLDLISNWLSLRAHSSMAAGDLEQAFNDLTTLILIRERAIQGATPKEIINGRVILGMAISIVEPIVNHPEFDFELLRQVERECSNLRKDVADRSTLDRTLRAQVGVFMDEIYLQGKKTWMVRSNSDLLDPLPPGWIQGAVVVDEYNAIIDEAVRLLHLEDSELSLADITIWQQNLFSNMSAGSNLWLQPRTTSTQIVLLNLHVIFGGYLRMLLEAKVLREYDLRRLDLLLAAGKCRLETGRAPGQPDDLSKYLQPAGMMDPLSQKPWRWQESEEWITVSSPSSEVVVDSIKIRK